MSYVDDYGGAPRREGPNLRWLAALILAVIGIVTYMTHTQVNPVTGEKQHIAMSVDQERAMGLEAAPEMAAKMGGQIDPSQDIRARAVRAVGRRLVERSVASRSPYADNFHFFLLGDPETVNAFALPGGQVFITVGLYDKLETEAQLGGVLGHEIGHVIERHSAQQMAKGQLGQMLALAVGIGASGDDRGRKAQMAAIMANQMIQLHYSRADESQADEFGLKAMADAGYDPNALLDVMRILKEVSKGSRQPEFLSSHPLPDTRLRDIRATIDQRYPNGIPDDLTKGRTLPH